MEERERLERIRQGFLVEGGAENSTPKISGRIQESSFIPTPSASDSTPTIRPRPLPTSKVEAEASGNQSGRSEFPRSSATAGRPDLAPQRTSVDPSQITSKEELRRLSEEDTKRRITASVVEAEPGKAGSSGKGKGTKMGVEGVGLGGGGLAPRRRGGGGGVGVGVGGVGVGAPGSGPSSTEGTGQTYSIPTAGRSDISPQRSPADPGMNKFKEQLRRLSEEATRRRMAESGVEVEPGKAEESKGKKAGIEGVGLGCGGLSSRRRGGG